MARAVEPHTTPKAPEDRAWSWHGSAEADKVDQIIEGGGSGGLGGRPVGDAGAGRGSWWGRPTGLGRRGVYRHLAEHFEEFGKEPPSFADVAS